VSRYEVRDGSGNQRTKVDVKCHPRGERVTLAWREALCVAAKQEWADRRREMDRRHGEAL
jgi:hypothetical protein